MSDARLPQPWGLHLDRSRPLRFRFEGRAYEGLAGDTLASALAANGVDLLSRSFKHHRPRGLLTTRGLDANTYVQVGDEPNVPADRLALYDGLSAHGQNYRGSLARDRDRHLERLTRFLPVGFYYKAFYRPSWRFWERLIRAKAGLGRLDPSSRPAYHDKAYLHADVAVIGAGPAGLAAAAAASAGGAEVVLIDDEPRPGGSLLYGRDPDGPARVEAMLHTLRERGVRVLSEATCTGLFADNWLAVVQGSRLHKLRARSVVLATGSVEQPMVFRNNDLPGVMPASAVQRLLRLWAVRPGRRAVVVTANGQGYEAALDLRDAGVTVAQVLDLRDDAAARTDLPIRHGWTVTEALPGRAGPRLEAVLIDRIAGQGRTAGEPEAIACDLLVTSAGYTPLGQLACHAGARLVHDSALASFRLEDLPPGLHLAGSVNHVFEPERVLADGRAAGEAALAGKPRPTPPADIVSHPWPIFPHPKGKDFVDLDEDQTVQDLRNAVADGFDSPELAKRYTTAGMGPSQGRHAALNALRIVRSAKGGSLDAATTTQRPPFLPESFAHLAGRGFEPYRLTPMHHRHLELGAEMMVAGLWYRPAFYGSRDAIAEEVRAVRTAAGLIDVSTLGGLEVRGPDAAELLGRIYTGTYEKQPVGRTRYVLACDQTGAIIDDGVACRLAPDHFYVTATTSGVDALYRSMLRWQAEWRLDADIANVTAAFAAVSLAGPRSRETLARLDGDIDLSPAAFPYLAIRTGRLAGIPVRILRVGFVGELGYEIHCPASYGESLWDLLLASGARPFGVEAQRVLRLEKGHLIVGQDTDGLTFPHEAGLEWAVAKGKPFFTGQRAIEVQARRPLTRRLVGFTLPPDAPVPPECVLVIRKGEIAGRVTSAAYSEVCGAVVGLAYVHPADAEPGARFTIKLEDGSTVDAAVTKPPFYDSANERQAL